MSPGEERGAACLGAGPEKCIFEQPRLIIFEGSGIKVPGRNKTTQNKTTTGSISILKRRLRQELRNKDSDSFIMPSLYDLH